MKKLMIIVVVLISNGIFAQDTTYRVSMFFSNGQAVPLGSYSASTKSNSVIDIAKATNYGRSWNLGMNIDIYNEFAFTFNIHRSRLALDSVKFNKLHEANIYTSESYLEKHRYTTFNIGIIRRFRYKRFNFDPGFSFGATFFKYGITEYYGKSSNDKYYLTHKYNYFATPNLLHSLRLNTVYNIIQSNHFDAGIHFLFKLNYTNPKILINESISDKRNHSYYNKEYTVKDPIFFMYWGFGLSVQIKS